MIRDFFRHRILGEVQKPDPVLPDKPSALIRVALADLRAVEKNPLYDVNMDFWHMPAVDPTDTCSVCFAGAVMAQRLGIDITDSAGPLDFEQKTFDKLTGLNYFRQGKIEGALEMMEIDRPHGIKRHMPVVPYEDDSEQFHEDMQEIATYLEDIGL